MPSKHKTLGILFGGEAVVDVEHFASLIHDIALLDSLGPKLVLVHGAGRRSRPNSPR